MGYINLLALTFFDMFMLVCIMLSFKSSMNIKDIFIGGGCIILGTLVIGSIGHYITSEPISLSLNILIAFLIVGLLSRQSFKEIIILYIFALSIMYGIQFLVIGVNKIILDNFEYTFKYGLISQIAASIVVMIFVWLVPIKNIYLFITERNKWFKMITVNIFAIYYILLMLWYTNLDGFLESLLGVLILVIVILIVNTIILNNGLQNQATLNKMHIYDTYLPIIETIIEEIRAKQHDYHNHIQTLESIQTHSLNHDLVQDYKEEVLKEDIWEKLIKMDNKIIIAFLYSKYVHALSLGITIKYTISNYLLQTEYTDYELVELFGILIDNAIEATNRVNEKTFDVLIGYEGGMNIIQTKSRAYNITSDKIKKMFEYGHTSKHDKGHGIGLYKIQKLLKKSEGNIVVDYNNEENEISFAVTFK